MRGLLVVMFAAFVGSVQGGAITSGSILLNSDFFGGFGSVSANLSGINFGASLGDGDVGTFSHGGSYPFLQTFEYLGPFGSNLFLGSGIVYNGVYYSGHSAGPPFVTALSFTLGLISPDPTITGPGSYPVTFLVQLSYCLSSPIYCETDTGFATGAFNYVSSGSGDVFTGGLTLDITVPEPSTLTYVGFAGCFGCLIAAFARTRRGTQPVMYLQAT